MLLVCTALVAPWQEPLLAQEARGTIVGSVMDGSGAVIPGAPVVVINKAMGTRVSLTTNAEGLYQATYLIPGLYRIEVEAAGFKKNVRDDVEVRVNDRLEVNFTLDLGVSTETVTVTGETPLLNTATASSGSVIDSRRVTELPIAHGNPYQLIALAGGVSFTRDPRLDRPFEPTHIVGYAMDGTRANRSDVTMDGAPSTATANAGEVIASFVPPADIVQEFKVQTATFDASFGQTEGGVTNISIKSGTNSLHGTAYWNKQAPSWFANDFFGNRTGTPASDFNYNRWGGSVGGPLYIPKVYDGRNKTFFMWGYEGIHESRPRNNGTFTVPTEAMKNGDFSALLAAGSQYTIYNPFSTTEASGGHYTRAAFPENKIPSSLFDPVAKKVLDTYFPKPLQAGNADGSQNYLRPDLMERAKYYTHTWRADHVISDKQRVFARTSIYRRDSTYNNYFDNLATGSQFQFLSRSAVLDDVYTVSPTTVLNFRYGYNRFVRADAGNTESLGMDLTTLGFSQQYNDSIPEAIRRFPRFDIAGYQGTGVAGEWRPNDIHSVNATIQKAQGTHFLKGGMEFRAYRETRRLFANDQTGRFNFDTTWTRGPQENSSGAPNSLGQSVASFLLGLPSLSNSFVARAASYAEQSTSWGFFIHDDWKVSQRLTLNLGLRWEFEGPLTERFDRSVRGFDPSIVMPFEAAAQAAYAGVALPEKPQLTTRGGLTFANVNGEPRGVYETPKRNLMPRIGLTYRLTDRTVLRSGYGVFYGFLGQRRGDVIQSGFSQNTPFIASSDNGRTFTARLSDGFTNILEPKGAADGYMTFVGQGITFFEEYPLMPYMQRWQLGVQHQLAGGFLAEATYVGNRGTNVEISRNWNVTPQEYLSHSLVRDNATRGYLSGTVANPLRNLLPAGAVGGLTGSTIARERLLRPFPQFDSVNSSSFDGYSWYHSLQVSVEKRFSKGYTIQANYTFSKFMQATELLNSDDPRPVEVISDLDRPHRFVLSGIVEFPFGYGRRLLSGANPVVARIVGGWQLSGIYTYQSGAPIGFGNLLFLGDVNDIKLPSDQQTVERWFNTDASIGWIKGTNDQLDRNVRYFPLRFGFLRAAVDNNYDFALIKNTRITEGKDAQFKAEFLNAFNHPRFNAPNTTPTGSTFGSAVTSTQANYARRIQMSAKFIF